MMRRIALVPFLLLAACGLHPLYGGGSGSEVSGLLSSVEVAPIAGQQGWLVRTKLLDRLGETGRASAHYRLDVTLDDNITSYGLRADQAATQERRSLRAGTSSSTCPTVRSCWTRRPDRMRASTS